MTDVEDDAFSAGGSGIIALGTIALLAVIAVTDAVCPGADTDTARTIEQCYDHGLFGVSDSALVS
jgi:hypothetical protein